MNKLSLKITIIVLLLASMVFNIIQYNEIETVKGKLAYFSDQFGPNASVDDAQCKREYIATAHAKKEVPVSQILALKGLLESQDLVQSVQYFSAEQALADFKKEYQDDPATLQALEKLDSNPLSGGLTIAITHPLKTLVNFIHTNDKNSIIDKTVASEEKICPQK